MNEQGLFGLFFWWKKIMNIVWMNIFENETVMQYDK